MKYILLNEESARLKYRALVPEDFEEWSAFFEDPKVAEVLGMDSSKSQKELTEGWFKLCQERYDNDLGGMNVLECKETGKIVGQCGILVQELDGKKEIEIGYSLIPKYWGKGYASEASQKVRDFAFENNFSDNLISIIHEANKASVKVALRNGMQKFKSTEFKGMPVNVFQITKKEWEELKNSNN